MCKLAVDIVQADELEMMMATMFVTTSVDHSTPKNNDLNPEQASDTPITSASVPRVRTKAGLILGATGNERTMKNAAARKSKRASKKANRVEAQLDPRDGKGYNAMRERTRDVVAEYEAQKAREREPTPSTESSTRVYSHFFKACPMEIVEVNDCNPPTNTSTQQSPPVCTLPNSGCSSANPGHELQLDTDRASKQTTFSFDPSSIGKINFNYQAPTTARPPRLASNPQDGIHIRVHLPSANLQFPAAPSCLFASSNSPPSDSVLTVSQLTDTKAVVVYGPQPPSNPNTANIEADPIEEARKIYLKGVKAMSGGALTGKCKVLEILLGYLKHDYRLVLEVDSNISEFQALGWELKIGATPSEVLQSMRQFLFECESKTKLEAEKALQFHGSQKLAMVLYCPPNGLQLSSRAVVEDAVIVDEVPEDVEDGTIAVPEIEPPSSNNEDDPLPTAPELSDSAISDDEDESLDELFEHEDGIEFDMHHGFMTSYRDAGSNVVTSPRESHVEEPDQRALVVRSNEGTSEHNASVTVSNTVHTHAPYDVHMGFLGVSIRDSQEPWSPESRSKTSSPTLNGSLPSSQEPPSSPSHHDEIDRDSPLSRPDVEQNEDCPTMDAEDGAVHKDNASPVAHNTTTSDAEDSADPNTNAIGGDLAIELHRTLIGTVSMFDFLISLNFNEDGEVTKEDLVAGFVQLSRREEQVFKTSNCALPIDINKIINSPFFGRIIKIGGISLLQFMEGATFRENSTLLDADVYTLFKAMSVLEANLNTNRPSLARLARRLGKA
ncbi:hypothetical protein EJ04DRAFT_568614 [Polyplosphaeria fusca]|uniref:Uncharacterized protein n=1 Tax=Polyplosphaeria fusca TaxID=682080 RepID=A0A9P4QQZ1_9PLEO|nr:hypothetical protein EJ04DRAFT_568614 [Polyplosphaeria fusca]